MKYKTKNQLINFENRMIDLFEEGELPFLMHFCGGNEDQLIKIFEEVNDGDYVFSSHRTHYHYLLSGGDEKDLEQKLLDGDSMFVFNRKLNFFSSSILAGTCGIAAGVALALKLKNSKQRVWCFIGDGAEDQGHFYEAVKFVQSMKLPCTFIVEDNDRSVETNKEKRGSSFIMNWPECVIRYEYKPTYPHAGTNSGKRISFKNLDKWKEFYGKK
jgi:TPP-dependent pyruvate/acetoin dehydrogenase alpha subunit